MIFKQYAKVYGKVVVLSESDFNTTLKLYGGTNFLNYTSNIIYIHCHHMQVCVRTLDWRVSKEGGLGLF